MTQSIAHSAGMLSPEELDNVSGGFKTDPNYDSKNDKNVIDARGGQLQWLGWTFTFDVNGKVSSSTPPR